MQQILYRRQSGFDVGCTADGSDALVLDTNVVLDLLMFQDAQCDALAAALAVMPGRWHATPPMRDEFESVLTRPGFDRLAARRLAARQCWAAWATMVASPDPAGHLLPCRDPADQMFLDLAVRLGSCILLSRDAEVLRLRRRAASFGVRIATPQECVLHR